MLAASSLLPVLLLLAAAWRDHDRMEAGARADVERLAAVAHEHALKVLETNTLVLDRLEDRIRGMSWPEVAAQGAELHRWMRALDEQIAQIIALHLVQPDGETSVISLAYPTPPLNLTSRAYFRAMAAGEAGILLGEPFRSPMALPVIASLTVTIALIFATVLAIRRWDSEQALQPTATPDRRILLWYWGRRGAGGQLTLALAEALARQPGVKLALAISAQAELRPEIEALGLPTEALPTYASAAGFVLGFLRLPWLAWRLRRQARAFRADAVVSVMTHLWTPLVAPLLRRGGLRYVPFVHDAAPHPGDPGWLWDWRLNTELDAACAAFALSDAVAAALHQRRPGLPVPRLPLGAHLPPALLNQSAPPRPPAGAAPRFLLFGRLRAYKGLDLLRDAWPLLHERHPGATLLVVGEGDRDGAALVFNKIRQRFNWLELVWADGGRLRALRHIEEKHRWSVRRSSPRWAS